jgi:16S rRNA (guanine527-N7)-methyltransferase
LSGPPADALDAILERARAAGFLGPGPVGPQRTHAQGFGAVVERHLGRPPTSLADLGTGGGIPGLVLAARWPASHVVLIDAMARRADALRAAVAQLGWDDRVMVVTARAEVVARRREMREAFEAVTARGFGRPAVTAEVAAGLVAVHGVVVISEPPGGDRERWPEPALDSLALSAPHIASVDGATYACMTKLRAAPQDVPRATKVLVKRPRW